MPQTQSTSQQNLSTARSRVTSSLPDLESTDPRFLNLEPLQAGRAVILELHARAHASREARVALWRRYQRIVNLEDLGRAAQSLECAHINWRQAPSNKEVLTEANLLLD